ncbi:MAG: heavy metal translocating P-type ATPase [Spirochaetaceae bacterium]
MDKIIEIDGLNCASCANKIEAKINAVPWIKEAKINFAFGNIFVKMENSRNYSLNTLQKIVDDIEPGVLLRTSGTEKEESFLEKNRSLIKLCLSLPLFIVGLLSGNNLYIQIPLLTMAYLISGFDVLLRAIKNIIKGRFFDEFFLMSIATIGAFIVGEVAEGVGVMIFFQLGEFFQDLAVGRTKKSIKSLLSIKPDFARLENGEIVKPETVKPGDIIEVRPGEKIPIDGVILSGITTVDTKTITGESIPRNIQEDAEVLSGFVNLTGNIKVEVSKTFKDSTISKILEMVQNESSKKTTTENFITKFSKVYTPIVVFTALAIAVLTPLFTSWTYDQSIYKSLIFLVISCPCALVISVPLGYFGGIGRSSREGILIKGSSYLEALNSVTKFVFDKTGTLTKGLFTVVDIFTTPESNVDELLDAAFKVEHKSNHPIAQAITQYCNVTDIDEPQKYIEVSGNGIEAEYQNSIYLGGKKEFLIQRGIKILNNNKKSGTKVYISKNNIHLGTLTLADVVKEDSHRLVKELGENNIYMLTGDNKEAALSIGKELNITNIKHSQLPLDKANFIKDLGKTEKVLFVGDGINDAPVLASSYVGVSMGGLGSDVAIEASDIVIMTDEPSKIITAIKISKFTKKIIIQNIIIALGFKVIIMTLGIIGIAGLWLAIFADVGVGLIAILNSVRTLNYKID